MTPAALLVAMLPLFGNGSFTLDDVLIAVRNAKLSTVAEYLVKGQTPTSPTPRAIPC